MIASLRGKIIDKGAGYAVLECGGVGFSVQLSRFGLDQLGAVGSEAFIYVHMNVREDAMELFGFPDPQERECFRMITGVSGIGPKGALAILSELTPDELAASVLMGDKANITRAKGVGPKAAERLIVELKDKFKGMTPLQVNAAASTPAQGTASKSLEIIEALMALGFTQPEAKHALGGLDLEALSVEEAITQALKGFSL
ncbi:MAG: Holliday junction branch migration protein RuvA [Clostridia bacterium]|nr:Holliday junction branch migration protein RuvA [Clostridia bacterium]